MNTIHSEASKVEARTDTRASCVVVAIVMVSALCGVYAIDSESAARMPHEVAIATAE